MAEPEVENFSNHRLFVGGLFPEITKDELQERFKSFGEVNSVEIKIRKDYDGSPIKTFAYVDMKTDETNLKKLMNIYNRSKWKGSQLKIQKAKENFLLRLEKERQEQEELKKKKKEIKDTKDDLMKTTDNVGDGNIANMKPSDAKPGTLVPGQKNWIVGKYGRVLPIVQMKRNGRSKLVKIDPSKYTHAVKRIKETDDKPGTKVNLTWELEERDNDVTKKRKGDFPTWRSGKKKCSDFTEIQSKLNEIISRYKVDDDNTEMEVVPVASDKNTGSVALRNSRGKVLKDSRKSNDVGVERFDSNSDSNDDVTLENSTGQNTAMDLSRFDSDSDNDNDDSGLTSMFIPVKNGNKGKIENQAKKDIQLRKEQTIANKSVSSVDKESSSADNQGSTKCDDKKGAPAPKIIEGKKKLKEFQGLRFLSSNTTVSGDRPVKETKSASKSSKYASSDDEDCAEICGPTVFKQSGDRVNTNIFQSKTFTSQKLSQSKTFASHDLLTDEFSSGMNDTSHKAEDLKELSDNDDDSDFESFVKREMLKTKSPGINERLGTNIKVNATSQKKTVGDTVSTTVNKTVEDMIVGSNVNITLDTKPNSKSEFANYKLENASENSMTSNDSDEDVDTSDEESDSIENQSVKSNDEYNISNADSDNKDKNENKSKNFQHGKQTIDNNSVSSLNKERIPSSFDKPKRTERTKSDDKKGVPEPKIIEGKKKLKEFQGIRFLSSYNQVLVSDEKPVQETKLASMPKKYVSSDEEDDSVEICGPTVSKQSVGQLKTNFFQPKAFASHNLLADEFFCCGITDASHTPKEDEQLSDDDDDSDFESFVKREMLKSKSPGVNKQLDTNIKVNANSQKKTTEDSVEGTDIKKTLNDKPNSQSALTYENKSESSNTSDDSDNDDTSDSENDSMENENTRSNAEPNIANSNCAAGTVSALKDGTKENLKNLKKDVRNDILTSDDSGEESGDNVKDDDVDEMNGSDVDSNEDDEDSDSNSDADDDTGDDDDDDDGSNDEDDISIDNDEESDDDSDFEKLISEAVNEIKTPEGTESSETDKPSLIVDIGKIKESDDTSVNKPNKISSNEDESYMEVDEAKLGSESEDSDSESEGSDSGSDESDTDSEDVNNESGDSNSESDGSDSTNEDTDSVPEHKDDNILNIKKLEKDPVSEESETLLDVTKLTTADDKISSGTESCNMNATCNKVNEKGGKTSDSNSKSINAKDVKEKIIMSKRQGLVQSRSKEENDRKRLEALKQKQKENMAQKSLIQTALANIDKGVPTNNKIIFESDSDDDGNNNDDKGDDNTKLNDGDDNDSDTDDDEDNDDDDDDGGDDDDDDNNAALNARKYGVETKTKSLFDSSDDDDDDDDDDDERFKIRKEFEGTAGSKLATLQSRYGNDERFKLDSRFIESDTDEDVPAVVDQEDETQRSLKILQSVVGIKAMKGVTFNEKARKKFKDIGSLKYDPTKVEHQEQFEVKRKIVETSDENESKKKKKKTDKQDQVEPEIVLPEVSKEKFHQISDTLTDIFKKKSQSESQNEALTGSGFSLLSTFGNNQSEDKPQNGSQTGSGFSLLSMFGKNQSDDEADNSVEDVAIPIPQKLRTDHLSLDNRFKVVDDDNGDDDEKEQPSSDDDEQSPDSKKNLNTEPTTSSDQQNIFNRPSTFFFLPNDLRLKDSVEKTSKIVDRETWFEKKRELVSCHKKKYKNYMRKHKDGKRRNNNTKGSHRGGHHR